MKKLNDISMKVFALVLLAGTLFISCSKDDDPVDTTPQLTVTSFSPATARENDTVTITGTGFNATNYTLNMVKFTTNRSAIVTSATETELKVLAPDCNNGPITVTVGEQSVTTTQNFTFNTDLPDPKLLSVVPESGYVGSEVNITGENFGADISAITVYFNDVEATEPELGGASNNTINVNVPEGLEPGEVTIKVVRGGYESNTWTYTVLEIPTSVKIVYWTSADGIYKGEINSDRVDISQLYSSIDPQGIEVDTEGGYIYWGNPSGKILRAAIGGTGEIQTLYDGVGYVVDIAVDRSLDKIFILCYDAETYAYEWIKSAALDGGSIETLYTLDQSIEETWVWSIKILQDDIYWTEENSKHVMKGSVNGSSEAVVLFDADDGLNDPKGIAIDEENNKIYIVDTNNSIGTIFSGSLNGGDLTTFVEADSENLINPNDAEIDLENNYLFWMNNTNSSTDGKVMRVTLDGSNVMEPLFGEIDKPFFFDLDIH
ncbi:IPT/TIG domain-containing protein [Maribellus comscasis]|nr:IPT/TIG domain-containing protein [Maribellus comscasis]